MQITLLLGKDKTQFAGYFMSEVSLLLTNADLEYYIFLQFTYYFIYLFILRKCLFFCKEFHKKELNKHGS